MGQLNIPGLNIPLNQQGGNGGYSDVIGKEAPLQGTWINIMQYSMKVGIAMAFASFSMPV